MKDLFASFWAALDGRALSALDRTAASAAFLSSLLECLIFICRRWTHTVSEEKTLLFSDEDTVRRFVHEQVQNVWLGLKEERLKVDGSTAGILLVRTVIGFQSVDGGLGTEVWDVITSEIEKEI